jgi:hypothetical protein
MFCPYCGTKVSPSCGYEFRDSDDSGLKPSYTQKVESYPTEVDKRDQEIEELKQKVKTLEDQVQSKQQFTTREAYERKPVGPTPVTQRKKQNDQCCVCFIVFIIIAAVIFFLVPW